MRLQPLLRPLSLLAFGGLLVSAAIHVGTFVRSSGASWSVLTARLHVGAIAAGLLFIFRSKGLVAGHQRRDFWKAITNTLPSWVRSSLALLFLYYMTAGVVAGYRATGFRGVPAEVDGKLVLYSHGEIIQELTEDEYRRSETLRLRWWSSGWMLFYGLGAAAFFRHSERSVDSRRGDGV